jgi:hypothetical protein
MLFADIGGLEARDFPLASCKGANGTIAKLSGVDTDHASMEGSITEPDVIEYCVRQKGARETLDHCVHETVERTSPTRYRAAANCPQHLLESKIDKLTEQFKLITQNDERAWKSVRTGKVLGNSCGDGTPPLLEQFKILCPREADLLNLQ